MVNRRRLFRGQIGYRIDRFVDEVASSDYQLASTLASEAGSELLRLRLVAPEAHSRGASWHEAQGDSRAHSMLVRALATLRPHDAVLSEEGDDDLERLDSDRTWILDPLDGSIGYGLGSPEWAVHVALVSQGHGVTAAVAVPSLGLTLSSGDGPGVPKPARERPIVVVGRSRAHVEGAIVARSLNADLAACGSAGFKAALVIMGVADAYLHATPLWEWDVCAPAVVARAAGLHVSGIDGSDLVFNQLDPVVPGLLICRPELAEPTLVALGA